MKPLLRRANIKRRNDWALDMMARPQTFWNNVIFCESQDLHYFLIKVEYRCGVRLEKTSVMVWGAIWTDDRSALM